MQTSDPPPNKPVPKAVIPGDPSPMSVNRKVSFRLLGLALILIGVGIIVWQTVYPSPEQQARLREAMGEGGGGNTLGSLLRFWPSAVLFILGGLTMRAGK